MAIKIPKSFTLYSHEIKVKINNNRMNDRNNWGLSELDRNNIILSTLNSDKTEIPKSIQLHTFYHEKVHHIFNALHEKDLCNNEKLVDNFANLLLQSDLTSKY